MFVSRTCTWISYSPCNLREHFSEEQHLLLLKSGAELVWRVFMPKQTVI